ncbi:asparagine synthase (glutamine-hydrolyzing) [Flavobacterium jejuense]|uniref:asparagine synthase (glutamine-hydrolyzing) n=1 Tax=Flavobacterium jejuense TaxID=1544455 RepID=A0ABX0IWI0_9FLAO|nr:asparagine synthase (glutamine-hydrolyzing) [Flavobacterium jejuense]NHN26169.1 asparagine synthase (glutamine-hydrolyzing) [Flavobacterium jejuense]
MCGFLIEYSPRPLLEKKDFLTLLEISKKRGPDYQGYWSNNSTVQFGFNRLAIVDLSEAGNQPMHSFNGRFTVVFNGEIYNHKELRNKLEYINFRGNSDTETITACLEEWGVLKTVKELDGMFALSIYDHLTKELTLVRDFAGIKPLFYGYSNGKLIAASQYDQIIQHKEFKNKSINPQVLKLYLQQHFMPAPFGLYEDTFQVLPGEMITFNLEGKKTHHRYWEMPSKSECSITSEKEAQFLVEETLNSCVQDQLLADVSLGAFLSGGVDSPLICSFAKKYKNDLSVFSIGSDSKIHDESERARQFAEALELEQEIWNLTAKETLQYWNEATSALHEPLADFSILPTYLVSKLAKKNVTVALSGDGGDELFFGYERFWSIGKNIKYQNYPPLIRKAVYGFDKYTTGNKRINDVVLSSKQSLAHENLHSRFRPNWLNAIAPELIDTNLPHEWSVYNYSNEYDERGLLGKLRKAEFYGMMQKTLRKVDLASMENSLEVRVPFLQKKMIEASLQIDPMLSYGNGKQKQLLKSILNKRVPAVPEEQVKKGFSVPLSKWIKEDLKEEFSSKLLDTDFSTFGFDKKQIEKLLSTHINGEQDLKWPLFTLYALAK